MKRTKEELAQFRRELLIKAREAKQGKVQTIGEMKPIETEETPDYKVRLRQLVGKEYLNEDERDELDSIVTIQRSDPDFNIDEYMNNR